MKKRLILVLLIALAGSMSLSAQTKKKRSTRKKATTTKLAAKDTSKLANAPSSLPSNAVLDTMSLKAVPDSDDGYLKSIVMTKARPFPIFEPSANNVKYYHQYKRDIMLNDRKNAKFNTPGATLIDALLQGVKNGVVTPYDATDSKANAVDNFTLPMTYNKLYDRLRGTTVVSKTDSVTGDVTGSTVVKADYNPASVVGYRIKEDVYYDKQRGKVETRIVGIAPIYIFKKSTGDSIGIQPLCWFKYKQARVVFAKMDVSDADKNLYDVSMDDMFLQRQFKGDIVYESNAKGERIQDYEKTPEDRAKEAARIEKKLADYKQHIWNYTTDITAVSVPDKPEKATKTKKSKTSANTGTPVTKP